MNASRLYPLMVLLVVAAACLGCGTKDRTPTELAEYYFSRPDYPKALEACRTAMAEAGTDADKADIHVIRGRCYVGQGQEAKERDDNKGATEFFAKAIAEFTTALKLNEAHLDALHNRRMAYRLTGESEREAQDYALIRQLDPNYQTAYQNETEDDPILRIRKLNNHFSQEEEENPEETRPEATDVAEEPSIIELDDDESQSGDTDDRTVAQTGPSSTAPNTPGQRVSVADFEPSASDPTSQFSQWLSQHQMDPTTGRQPRTIPPPTTRLPGLGPDETEEDGDSDSDETADGNEEPSTTGVTSPPHWPSSSQWPRFPGQNPSLPTTGIVAPGFHPSPNTPPPTAPYRGMVSPRGSTGVGVEPLLNPSPPYASQPSGSSQTLPTTGVTGSFSPYRQRGSSLGPYRPSLPDGFRQDGVGPNGARQPTQPGEASNSRLDPRVPQSLQPQVPKRPTAPRPTLQYQTSPLASPSIQPPGK